MTKLREKYRNVDVLMVDDVQFIIGKESTQEEFFHTFNALHAAHKQIILSSDKPPKEMETLDERFRSRFEWGLIADIQPPDYETRMAILRKNAETYDRQIDEEIIKYIATNIKSNIRELEGAFNKIIAFAKLNKVDLTLSLAEEALKDVIYPNKPKEITPSLIINVVAEHFGVKAEDITSKKRNSEFVQPRQVVMYLCRELTDTSFTNIGKLLGKKDHTTIIHGVNKVAAEIQTNEELRNKIDIITKRLIPPDVYISGTKCVLLLITDFKASRRIGCSVNKLRVILRLFCQIHKISIPFFLENSIIRLVMHISTSLIKETTKFFYYFYITRIHAYANQPERKLCTHEISLFKSKSFKRRTDRIQSCSQ